MGAHMGFRHLLQGSRNICQRDQRGLPSRGQSVIRFGGSFGGWVYGAAAHGGSPDDKGNVGPQVNSYSDFAGVFGTGIYVTGVAGTSVNNVGVYGQTGELSDLQVPQNFPAGVFGAGGKIRGLGQSLDGVVGWSIDAIGVKGWSPLGNAVAGESIRGRGVHGYSNDESGVHGDSKGAVGVKGVSAPESPAGGEGPTIPHPVTIAGVVGTSNIVHGVIGTSTSNAGVFGYSSNGAGIIGMTSNPASSAGAFFGDVRVAGNIYANNLKSAAVPFPDGSRRALYCMESPEVWFEDFGSAKLARGRAVVKLDANFAKVIKRGDYRVFVTPEGNATGSMCAIRALITLRCASSWAASQASRFPTALSAAARTSSNTSVSPRSTCPSRCHQGRRAHRVSPRRRQRSCVRSSHAWRKRRRSGQRRALRKSEQRCAETVAGLLSCL
jgi:hypothetical protein